MELLKTKGIWRLAVFVAATYALAVSADEVFTEASASRFNSHSIVSQPTNIGPGAVVTGPAIDGNFCSHLARIDSRAGAEYFAGADVNGDRVVPADVYTARTPEIRPQVNFEIPLPRNTVPGRRRFVSAGDIDIDLLSGVVTYNGEPLSLASLSSIREDCLRDFPDAGEASSK